MKSKKRLILPILTFLSFGMAVGTGVLNIVSDNAEPEMESVEAAYSNDVYFAIDTVTASNRTIYKTDDPAYASSSGGSITLNLKETSTVNSWIGKSPAGYYTIRGRKLARYDISDIVIGTGFLSGKYDMLEFTNNTSGGASDYAKTVQYNVAEDSDFQSGYNAYTVLTNYGTSSKRQNGYWSKLTGANQTAVENNLPTTPRIYVDYSNVDNSKNITSVMFYSSHRDKSPNAGRDNVSPFNTKPAICTDYNYDYRKSSGYSNNGFYIAGGAQRKIFPVSIPWNACPDASCMGITIDGVEYKVTVPANGSTYTYLRIPSKNGTPVWEVPQDGIGGFIYFDYASCDAGFIGTIGNVTTNKVQAQFSSGNYNDNTGGVSNWFDATSREIVTGLDGKSYFKFAVPNWATRVRFVSTNVAPSVTSSECVLGVTENVHYTVEAISSYDAVAVYTKPLLKQDIGPAYNTARLFVNTSVKNTNSTLWNDPSNLGVVTWKAANGAAVPTYCVPSSYNYSVYKNKTSFTSGTGSRKYFYFDIPYDTCYFRFAIINDDGSIQFMSSTIESIYADSPNSPYSYCYFIVSSDATHNTATHIKGTVDIDSSGYKVDSALITKLLEARDTCSSNIHNGYGDGALIVDNFYDGFTTGGWPGNTDVTTMDATRSYKIDYVMDCLENRQSSPKGNKYGSPTEIDIAIMEYGNSRFLIITIASVGAISLLLTFGAVVIRKKHNEK